MIPPSAPQGLADATRELLAESNLDGPHSATERAEPIRPAVDCDVIAVDGGSSVLLDLGSAGIVAVRAGWAHRAAGDAYEDHVPIARVRLVRRSDVNRLWSEVLREHAWGSTVEPPTMKGGQSLRAWAEGERTVVEFDAAMRGLRGLAPGSLLLIDGSLEDEARASDLSGALLRRARQQRVRVAAVSKDSSLSVSGLFPFTLEIEERARREAWPARFFIDMTEALDRRDAPTRTYAARFDARGQVYRVDAEPGPPAETASLFGQLAGLCNDAAYPGYPYPLARVHERVHYSDSESADLRRNLESRVAERRGTLLGMRLFGRGRDVLALGG